MKLNILFALLTAIAIAATTVFTGCSTTKGLGTDISNMGKGIEKGAKRSGAE